MKSFKLDGENLTIATLEKFSRLYKSKIEDMLLTSTPLLCGIITCYILPFFFPKNL